jgi:hypothetical protein
MPSVISQKHRSYSEIFLPEAYASYFMHGRLLAGTTASEIGSISAMIATEIDPTGTSYDPSSYDVIVSTPTYNTLTKVATFPSVILTISNTGTTALAYQSVVLVGNPTGKTPFAPKTIAAAAINSSTDRITWTAHGLSAGDKIMMRPRSGGSNPTSVDAAVVYRVFSPTTNDFQLSANGTSLYDISTGASGEVQILDARATFVDTIWRLDAPVSQATNTSLFYSVNLGTKPDPSAT